MTIIMAIACSATPERRTVQQLLEAKAVLTTWMAREARAFPLLAKDRQAALTKIEAHLQTRDWSKE